MYIRQAAASETHSLKSMALHIGAEKMAAVAQQLQDAVERFLDAYCTAFGEAYMSPKFHWLLHFPQSLRNAGTLVACFVHERKHRMLKRYCNDIRNTTSFEHSVLAEEPPHCYFICLCGFLLCLFSVAFMMLLNTSVMPGYLPSDLGYDRD